MIKGWNKLKHYDACIEMWNEIAEKGYRSKKQTSLDILYSPQAQCFVCEYFNIFCKCDVDDTNCPFIDEYGERGCLDLNSYFIEWEKGIDIKNNAIAIAQLFIDYAEKENLK